VTDEEAPQDLGERIRRIAATIAGEVDKRWAVGDESRSILDAAARSFGATMERWGRNPSLRHLLGGVERDVLTSPGERVELSASLGMSAALGTSARFFVDDDAVAETPIADGAEVRTLIDAPGPGIHRVGVKLCNDKGEVVSGLIGHRLLQVAGGRPVALVRAALFLRSAPYDSAATASLAEALRAMLDAGFELVYFDIHEKNRDALIHQEILEQQLPPGAILVYSAEEEELRSLGVDFVDMFASTAIRRLRAKGVPVTTILAERDELSDGRERAASKPRPSRQRSCFATGRAAADSTGASTRPPIRASSRATRSTPSSTTSKHGSSSLPHSKRPRRRFTSSST